MDSQVIDNEAAHRFELAIEGDDIAVAYYRIDENGNVVLTHTEVPQAHSGRGIGSKLAHGVFTLIRKSGRRAVIRCEFMGAFAARHPEYADLIAG